MIHFSLLSIVQFFKPKIRFTSKSNIRIVNSQSLQFFKKAWFNFVGFGELP